METKDPETQGHTEGWRPGEMLVMDGDRDPAGGARTRS